MKVDHVLILAAGKGTRMGEIGKEIPKVIWPVFNKTILELEVLYAKKIAPSASIHINVFNYKEKVLNHIKENKDSFEGVNILIEDDVLDVGGAIHNLASQIDYSGNLLILNSDQFLYFEDKIIEEALKELDKVSSILFTYEVNSSDGYNALDIHDERLRGIIKNNDLKENETVLTYTGMSLVRLESLSIQKGESKFFDSVADFRNKDVSTKMLSNFEYWDFGTLKRYHQSIFELVNSESEFRSFLNRVDAYKEIEIKDDEISYGDFILDKDQVIYKNLKESIN